MKLSPISCIVSDIHGCIDEYREMLSLLGYGKCTITGKWIHPQNTFLIHVGDEIDRSAGSIEVLKLVMELCRSGIAISVRSNHTDKLRRYLRDYLAGDEIKVKVRGHFADTLAQLGKESREFKEDLYKFLDSLPYIYEDDKIIVAHAAYVQDAKPKVQRELALVGETNGETDEDGYPIRTYRWRDRYKGGKLVFFGHDVFKEPSVYISQSGAEIVGLDTGCVFGGSLTAARVYDDKTFDFVQVKAKKVYCER